MSVAGGQSSAERGQGRDDHTIMDVVGRLKAATAGSARAPEGAGHGGTGPALERVGVTAIVVTRGDSPYARRTLSAVATQTSPPDRVVIVDTSAERPGQWLAYAAGIVSSVGLPVQAIAGEHLKSFPAAVAAAVGALGTPATAEKGSAAPGWLWLLHADSAPEPAALLHLRAAVEHAPSVAVAGAKQVAWEDVGELIEVGHTVSPGGHRVTGVRPGEPDQHQLDSREDTLAVGLAGALVRASAWQHLGGASASLAPYRDSTEFCVRAWRAGYRVIVVPAAVVCHARLALHGLDERSAGGDNAVAPAVSAFAESEVHAIREPYRASFGKRLRTWQLYRLVTASLPGAVMTLLWTVLVAIPRAALRMAQKSPRQAFDELAAVVWLIGSLGVVATIRRRAARTAVVSRRQIRPLMVSAAQRWRLDSDARAEVASARGLRVPRTVEAVAAIRTVRAGRIAALLTLAVAAAALVATAARPAVTALVGGLHLHGGALLPSSAGWAQWWFAVSSGWNLTDLGSAAPADPFVVALAPVLVFTGGDVQRAVSLLYVAAIPLAGLGAWAAAGALTRSTWLRWAAGLIWMGAPVLLMSAASGHLPAMLAHATLPWLVVALAAMFGVRKSDWWLRPARPSATAFGAAGLLMALLVAAAPIMLLPSILVCVAAAVTATSAPATVRRTALLVPLPAIALAAPLLVRAVVTLRAGGWRILIADPGAATADVPAEAWQWAIGIPSGLDNGWTAVTQSVPAWLVWLPLGSLAVLVVAAAIGAFSGGLRGRGARAGWLLVPVGLAVAGLSAATTVGGSAAAPHSAWPGAGLSLALAGLAAAALVGAEATRVWSRKPALVTAPVADAAQAVSEIPDDGAGGRDDGVAATHVPKRSAVSALAEGADASHLPVGDTGAADTGSATVLAEDPADGQTTDDGHAHQDGDGGEAGVVTPVPEVLDEAEGSRDAEPSDAFAGFTTTIASELDLEPDEPERQQTSRRLGAAALLAVTVMATALTAGWAALGAWRGGDVTATQTVVVPAVAQQMQESSRGARVLAVAGTPQDVHYQLLHSDGRELTDTSAVAAISRLRVIEDPVAASVAAVVGGDEQASAELTRLGVGAVLLADASGASQALAASLDEAVGLQRVTAGQTQVVWRVVKDDIAGSWARIVDSGGGVIASVPAQTNAIDTVIEPGTGGTLQIAETSAPGWRATLDGAPLARAADDGSGLLAFELPSTGGTLTLTYARGSAPVWQALQSIIVVAFALTALPVVRSRRLRQ